MKLITWNAAMKFREKIEKILPFSGDILVIPECEAPEKWKASNHLQSIHQFLWFGDNPNKGIGVITLNDSYQIKLHPSYNKDFRYIIPLIVSGEEDFIMLAVWSQHTGKNYDSYIGQIFLALRYYEFLLHEPCMIVGDWNSNKIFDHIKRVGTHSEVADFLESYSIKSAYHTYFEEEHGNESLPTHYFRKDKEMPFHIDFIFVSEEFLSRLSVLNIGAFDEWIKHSDHMPIVTELK